MTLCKYRTWSDNFPLPNVEYHLAKQDPSLKSIELTLEQPAANDTRDLLVWSVKVDAGKRQYLARYEVKDPKVGLKETNLKFQSSSRTITAEISVIKSENGSSSKMEFDLKVPNIIDLNTKYNDKKTSDENNANLVAEYKLAWSDRKEIFKLNRNHFIYLNMEKEIQLNSSALYEIQSTQFPEYNCLVSDSMRFNFNKYYLSDLRIELFNNRVRLLSTSKIDIINLNPVKAVGENVLVFEATPLKINYQIKYNFRMEFFDAQPLNNRIKLMSMELVGKDLEGRTGGDFKGSVIYEEITTLGPLYYELNRSLSYPGRNIILFTQFTPIKNSTFDGRIEFSPQKGKFIIIRHKERLDFVTFIL